MNLLLDSCVWGGARAELVERGHDVVSAADGDPDPGDDEILARAHAGRRILVTLDKDFGELAIVHRRPHSGIIRLVGYSARKQAAACEQVLVTHGEALIAGGIVTLEPGRVRVRSADQD